MAKKITTIEDLAALIQRTMASKEDVTSIKEDVTSIKEDVTSLKEDVTSIKEEITSMKGSIALLSEELHTTQEDVRYIRNTVSVLVRNDSAQDTAIEDHEIRIKNFEKKAGFVGLTK